MSHSLHYRITWETIVILIATSLCSAASLGCSVNPALSTFAAERRAAAPCYRIPVACDRVVSKLLLHCCNGTDRQTDGRTDTVHRLRCVYYAGSENNYVLSYYSSLQKVSWRWLQVSQVMFRIFGVIYTSLRNVTILQLQIVICCKKKFLKASTWAKNPKNISPRAGQTRLNFWKFRFFSDIWGAPFP